MTAPIWASLILAAFGAVAILFQTLPRGQALAVLAFAAAAGFAVVRLVPIALAAASLGLWLWRTDDGRAGLSRSGRAPDPAEVRSDGLRMTLDRVTGEMDGEVLVGPDTGRRLSELSSAQVRALAEAFGAAGDEESLTLLLAWLDRLGRRGEAETPTASEGGRMTEAEAYRVLGIEPGASVDEVRAAYRRLIRRVHPDLGGSGALAALLNAAKEVLDPGEGGRG